MSSTATIKMLNNTIMQPMSQEQQHLSIASSGKLPAQATVVGGAKAHVKPSSSMSKHPEAVLKDAAVSDKSHESANASLAKHDEHIALLKDVVTAKEDRATLNSTTSTEAGNDTKEKKWKKHAKNAGKMAVPILSVVGHTLLAVLGGC
jgi:hypothetical protein